MNYDLPPEKLIGTIEQARREIGRKVRIIGHSLGGVLGRKACLQRPLPRHVEQAAIYTRADDVVDWHDSLERDPRRNHEVGGTHIGLVFNPGAYRTLGTLLSHPQRN